jgi:hypothetical protein
MTKNAGLAGIGAGIGLALEFGLFMLSGFQPDTFAEPSDALAFLQARGGYLRAAVLVGAVGAALTTIFLVGLAARLRDAAPTRAAATLYFGVIGGAGHGLVALTFWVAIPLLVALAAREPNLAPAAVGSLTLLTSGAEAFGNLFLALSMAAAGWAVVSFRILPVAVGWIGLAAAALTLARIVGADTPVAFVAFFPSLIGAVVFRVWAGISLRSLPDSNDGVRTAGPVPDAERAAT